MLGLARIRPEPRRAAETPGADPGSGQDELWDRLVDEAQGPDFVSAWLTLQCTNIPAVETGLVLFEKADGSALAPVAVWPAGTADLSGLQSLAEEAVNERRGFVRRRDGGGGAVIAYPLVVDDHVAGLVMLDLAAKGEAAQQKALRDLHWGIGWLDAQILRRRADEDRGRLRRAGFALDMVAAAGEHAKVETAAMAVVNELANRMACDRVSLGLTVGEGGDRRIRLVSLSHAAWFRRRTALVMAIENAMEEALDQDASVSHPPIPSGPRPICVAHRALAEMQGSGAVVTAPMTHRGVAVGALTLERHGRASFSRDDALTAEIVAELVGPLLDLKRRQRRWLTGRLPDLLAAAWRRVFGPRHPTLKIGLLVGAASLAFLVLMPGTIRVTAHAVLEGSEQRAAAAPFAGFVASAPVRAGDVVAQDAVLAELDDKDLRLDQGKWRAEYAQLSQEKRKALAAMDRAEVALVEAKLEQAKAQIDLTTAKLQRARIRTPIAGIVISGDWTQKLGAPVEQGAVMFEVSPLESFRVTLKVEEGDIGLVRPGQTGTLMLAGRADAAIPLTVSRIASVAGVEDGQNLFRVEATLPPDAQAIRPGMEGVAKIEVGDDRLWWVLGRRLVDWTRLFVFRHWP